MAYDLKLGEHGDLILAPNRDILGVAGPELVAQRIRNRLLIQRGTWVYDKEDQLGSMLHTLFAGEVLDEAAERATMLVHEACRPMDDVSITGVELAEDEDSNSLVVFVSFSSVELDTDFPSAPYFGTIRTEIPTVS